MAHASTALELVSNQLLDHGLLPSSLLLQRSRHHRSNVVQGRSDPCCTLPPRALLGALIGRRSLGPGRARGRRFAFLGRWSPHGGRCHGAKPIQRASKRTKIHGRAEGRGGLRQLEKQVLTANQRPSVSLKFYNLYIGNGSCEIISLEVFYYLLSITAFSSRGNERISLEK